MSFACSHNDLTTLSRCCATLGELLVDSTGTSYCGTPSWEEFVSCAGIESQCTTVFLAERQVASSSAAASSSGAASRSSQLPSPSKATGAKASSSATGAKASGSATASGTQPAKSGAQSSAPPKKKKNSGQRTGTNVGAVLVLAVAVAAVLA